MTRPRLLDLYSGAGGAATGYHRAGFDVTGVDISPQPRYPFAFVQGDALDVLRCLPPHEPWLSLGPFDAVHASPPCQDHSMMQNFGIGSHGTGHLLDATRELLIKTGLPWVIENVPGSPMRADYKVCGCMVGLPRLRRERWFETSWRGFDLRPPCHHPQPAVPVVGHGTPSWYRRRYGNVPLPERHEVMGIDWKMSREELSEAIPPAYTEYIGAQLLDHLNAGAA